jgi:omega-6 fatty acid desaturase (delta-12 desaturase)
MAPRQGETASQPATVPAPFNPYGQVVAAQQDPKFSYRQAKPTEVLPSSVTLADIQKSLPEDVKRKSPWKAFKCIVTTLCATALGLYLVHVSPWYLLPFTWFFAGTAATGLFVIGHDCGHRSFLDSVFLCDVIGTIAMMPLVYPFESWRLLHNIHHLHTNKLETDNAWQPFQATDYLTAPAWVRVIYRTIKGPMWWFASVGHQISKHYLPSSFKQPNEQRRVRISVLCVCAFAFTVLPALVYSQGLWGLVKYWLMPFLGYHFWMSTFTMLHHTAPDIPFVAKEQWNAAAAQLQGTVHVEYPAWIVYLCHCINVHIPHHVSTHIPNYNLRAAHAALKQKWGKYMIESTFGWPMLLDVIQHCHIWHLEKVYVPFDVLDKKLE